MALPPIGRIVFHPERAEHVRDEGSLLLSEVRQPITFAKVIAHRRSKQGAYAVVEEVGTAVSDDIVLTREQNVNYGYFTRNGQYRVSTTQRPAPATSPPGKTWNVRVPSRPILDDDVRYYWKAFGIRRGDPRWYSGRHYSDNGSRVSPFHPKTQWWFLWDGSPMPHKLLEYKSKTEVKRLAIAKALSKDDILPNNVKHIIRNKIRLAGSSYINEYSDFYDFNR